MSPAGFEWSIGDAAAGTAMDQLVHTWDLGRQAGIAGPEIPVAVDASPQDRLLGAMERNSEA